MSDHTPSTEKPLTEVIVGIVEHNRGYPKPNIGVVLSHADRDTEGLGDALDQLVEEGRIVEHNGGYWLPEHAPDNL
ncbi:hypothetical protein C471_09295 [Halorubrum saccharovorum DSM 1137]|uniref:Uncharacterized protein n=1 Tax=Halorubrum saccharovorum DSM 1137 TaxID=1227484 RepID=M0DXD9_9EURY|nr:hypothetical protein [Halorubrum saccharovorum]ELZ38754.1 hypothetical protein C471_09295 [Halorubrum saccharovorum DSM 1137]